MTVSHAPNRIDVVPEDAGANRVLIVDDDITQRTMLGRILRKGGYDSAPAMSNIEARSLLENSPFGLVVTDLHMFAEDGIQLVRHLKDRYPHTYSIVVSGFVSPTDVAQIRAAGAFEVMTKPVAAIAFLEAVGRAFEQRARGLVDAAEEETDQETRSFNKWMAR